MYEGYSKRISRTNYACAANYQHYGIWLDTEELPPFITEEYALAETESKFYLIVQYHNRFLSRHQTVIITGDVDGDGNIIDNKVKKQFTFNKALFDFKSVGKEKLINKVKTILVFQ